MGPFWGVLRLIMGVALFVIALNAVVPGLWPVFIISFSAGHIFASGALDLIQYFMEREVK